MGLEDMVSVRIVPHFKGSAAMNLAREEALFTMAKDELRRTGTFEPIIGTYSFDKPSVILGYQQPISEVDSEYCDNNGIHVTMRKTGGGSVYLTPSEMQYFYILPFAYSRQLVSNVNQKLQGAFGDVGFSPQLALINGFNLLRMNKDMSFVFDAQKSALVYNGVMPNPMHMVLHHGTILVDDSDYHHMGPALKASPQELARLQGGNYWLTRGREVRQHELSRALLRNMPFDAKPKIKGFTTDEEKLAAKLHNDFYGNREKFSAGKKSFGICYLPGPDYDDKYRTEEVFL